LVGNNKSFGGTVIKVNCVGKMASYIKVGRKKQVMANKSGQLDEGWRTAQMNQ
jgi:hypothetical protein